MPSSAEEDYKIRSIVGRRAVAIKAILSFSFMTGKNRAIDFCFFRKYRSYRDGLSLVEFNVESSWFKGDHNPQYVIFFALLNFAIVDINWYNIHHIDGEDPSRFYFVDHQKDLPPSSNG